MGGSDCGSVWRREGGGLDEVMWLTFWAEAVFGDKGVYMN